VLSLLKNISVNQRDLMLERLQRDLGATMHHVGCGEGGLADDIDSIDANKAVFLVGGRGALDVYHVSAAADTFREVLVTHPHLQFAFVIVGFDNDPRGLWEISEARWYVKMFRELVGLDKFEFALDHVASAICRCRLRVECGSETPALSSSLTKRIEVRFHACHQ
jgi:hypothetical protein